MGMSSRLLVNNSLSVDAFEFDTSRCVDNLTVIDQYSNMHNASLLILKESEVASPCFLQETDDRTLLHLLGGVARHTSSTNTQDGLNEPGAIDAQGIASAP